MAEKNIDIEKEEIIRCLVKGRQKIYKLMIQSDVAFMKTWEENCAMLEFLRASCKKEHELRQSGCVIDVRIDELFPPCHASTLAIHLHEIAGVETLRELLSASLHQIRTALVNESACLTEVVLAMTPHLSMMSYAEYIRFLDTHQGGMFM